MRLSHVGITVSDLERSVKFYKEAFGFEPFLKAERSDEWLRRVVGYPTAKIAFQHMVLPNGFRLELMQYLSHPRCSSYSEPCGGGHVHFCLEVADIQKAAKKAKRAGGIVGAPETISDGPNKGAKVLYMQDPDEITIELYQKPAGAK